MGIGGDTNGLVLGYYVTEINPKHVRGRSLIIVQQFSSSFLSIAGTWIAYGIAYLPQDKPYSWRVANSLQFVPGVIFFGLIFLLPESPRWLARKYPEDDGPMIAALASIRALPVEHPDVIAEAEEIRDYDTWHVVHGSVSWKNIFTQKSLRKRLFHAFIPLLGSQLSGVGLLTIYAVIMYQLLGLTTQHNALLLNACLQILYAASALGSSYVVEKLGRRTCIVWGSLMNTLGLVCITGLAIGTEQKVNQVANGWVGKGFRKLANGLSIIVLIEYLVAFIVIMICNYWFLSTGPTVVYVNKIMPSQAREVGTAVANVVPIGVDIAMGQKWPLAKERLGPRSYVILLCTSALSFVLNWYFLVEPKGMSIEHIDELFGEDDKVNIVRTECLSNDLNIITKVASDEKSAIKATEHREEVTAMDK